MTVAQLKKHFDRRLRTKADKADVRRGEGKVGRLEQRMDDRFDHLARIVELA
jgi:hypothetical protein